MRLTLNALLRREEHVLPDGHRLVRLDVLGKDYPISEANRNVFLVDQAGSEIWRIASHECAQGADPFIGIDMSPAGQATGLTWDGWRFEINISDGSVRKIGWTKS